MKKNFLIEIGTEELPPKRLKLLMEAFADLTQKALTKAQLQHGEVHAYAAPRRLALLIEDMASAQPEQTIERRGPAVKAAYDSNGQPTKACLGFATSCAVSVEKLETLKTDKGEWLYYKMQQPGKTVQELLPEIVATALKQLPVAKPMRWNNREDEFVRPVHWMVMLYGSDCIPAKILGVETGTQTFGHRFHHPDSIHITQPGDYANLLRKTGHVLVDFAERRDVIRRQLESIASENNATVVVDEDLLNEVTGLVEWPVALLANYEERFLNIPAEVLITSLKVHQKCFPLMSKEGKMLPHFITVSNIESRDKSQVVRGNERVVRARLADAEFFYQTDLKIPLEQQVKRLQSISFQHGLGSLYEKSLRNQHMAECIAEEIHADVKHASRAAYLSKADLVTDMVGEFPELQGVMGEYYAQNGNEAPEVSIALCEYYNPRFSGDKVPESSVACAVAIADRIDNLVGIFGINQIPTGEKDPFGLRRAAIGVLRIIIEKQFDLDLEKLLEFSANHYQAMLKNEFVVEQVLDYVFERLRAWYHEQGIAVGIFNAVLARRPTKLLDFHRRIEAVSHFSQLVEAESLAAANKRVGNILAKQNGASIPDAVNSSLLTENAEKELSKHVADKTKQIEPLLQQQSYKEMLISLSSLRAPVDQFFDEVMVMVDEEDVRNNRLALLSQLRGLFLQVADISLLQK